MQYEYDKICVYSKALSYTALSYTGLAGSKSIWDTQIYIFVVILPSLYLVTQVARILSYTDFSCP